MTAGKRIALTGILGALAVALSFLESLLPPLPFTPPGFKLGLSNLAGMYAAGCLGLPQALFLGALKGGFAFLTRGFAAGAMSLSGGLCSALCTWLLFKRKSLSLAVIGVGGALAHNAAQLCAAYFLTATSVVFYVPVLLLYSVAAGVLTGALLRGIWPVLSRWGKTAR